MSDESESLGASVHNPVTKRDTGAVGAAGEHYVAFRLSQMGLTVGLPRGGSPIIDLFVSSHQGDRTVTLQVKTTMWAERQKGRAEAKALHHLEFPLSAKAADHEGERFLYVFVDLHGHDPDSRPDVYVVPSAKVKEYCGTWANTAPMVRWHPLIAEAAPYKNKWSTIRDLLGDGPPNV